jgi:hypothetical protein
MLCGDFNLIYQADDKNNGRHSRRMMGRFCHFLNDLEFLQLHLHGRFFTWSNERTHPTLEWIDRVFVSSDWELLFPSFSLQAISSRCSDHSPLLLSLENCTQSKRRFRRFVQRWRVFLTLLRQSGRRHVLMLTPYVSSTTCFARGGKN